LFPYEEATSVAPNRPRDMFAQDAKFLDGTETTNKRDYCRDRKTLLNARKNAGDDIQDLFYMPIRADSASMSDRWGFFPVMLSQAGTIGMSEMAIYDMDGNVFPCEFHVSVWNVKVDTGAMPQQPDNPADIPRDKKDPLGYNEGSKTMGIGVFWSNEYGKAFDQIRNDGTAIDNKEQSWYAGSSASNMIVGWGDFDRPLGYWPRMKGDKNAVLTGKFRDSSTWSYDFSGSNGVDFVAKKQTGEPVGPESYSAWVAVHVNLNAAGQPKPNPKWLYAMGRFFRKVEI
jgi:hypothetical protein